MTQNKDIKILGAVLLFGLVIYFLPKKPIQERDSLDKINPIYFYSSAYEEKNGPYSINCPQTKDIDWKLAIYTLSAYMQFEDQGGDFGPAEIQRNFDENCDRNIKIYEVLRDQIQK